MDGQGWEEAEAWGRMKEEGWRRQGGERKTLEPHRVMWEKLWTINRWTWKNSFQFLLLGFEGSKAQPGEMLCLSDGYECGTTRKKVPLGWFPYWPPVVTSVWRGRNSVKSGWTLEVLQCWLPTVYTKRFYQIWAWWGAVSDPGHGFAGCCDLGPQFCWFLNWNQKKQCVYIYIYNIIVYTLHNISQPLDPR